MLDDLYCFEIKGHLLPLSQSMYVCMYVCITTELEYEEHYSMHVWVLLKIKTVSRTIKFCAERKTFGISNNKHTTKLMCILPLAEDSTTVQHDLYHWLLGDNKTGGAVDS